jgi:hypothetical protein
MLAGTIISYNSPRMNLSSRDNPRVCGVIRRKRVAQEWMRMQKFAGKLDNIGMQLPRCRNTYVNFPDRLDLPASISAYPLTNSSGNGRTTLGGPARLRGYNLAMPKDMSALDIAEWIMEILVRDLGLKANAIVPDYELLKRYRARNGDGGDIKVGLKYAEGQGWLRFDDIHQIWHVTQEGLDYIV